MSIIKKSREKSGFTQVELSEKTGLSLRTIQRIEANNKAPKGHSLKVISAAFNLEPCVFQEQFKIVQDTKHVDTQSIKYINLSVLAFLGIPFGNIILPFLVWRKSEHLNW